MYCTNQTPEQRELNNHLLPFTFLFPSDEEEKRIHGDPAKQQWRNTEVSQRKWPSLLPPKGSSLLIDGGGEAKPSPIHIFNLQKIDLHSEIFGQSKRDNINCNSRMISVIIAPEFEEAPVTNFKKNQLTGMPAVSQQLELQVNSDVPHLISGFFSAHKHQDE